MEHDGCCFIIGAGVAGRDHLSGVDTAAVRTAAVRGAGHHGIPPVVSDPYRSGGRHFPCAGRSCGAVMGGDAGSCSAGDDLVSKVCTWRNALE